MAETEFIWMGPVPHAVDILISADEVESIQNAENLSIVIASGLGAAIGGLSGPAAAVVSPLVGTIMGGITAAVFRKLKLTNKESGNRGVVLRWDFLLSVIPLSPLPMVVMRPLPEIYPDRD